MAAADQVVRKEDIIKEGYVMKRSRFIKKWRQRWLVITKTHALTYETKGVYEGPTESINLRTELENFEKVSGHEING